MLFPTFIMIYNLRFNSFHKQKTNHSFWFLAFRFHLFFCCISTSRFSIFEWIFAFIKSNKKKKTTAKSRTKYGGWNELENTLYRNAKYTIRNSRCLRKTLKTSMPLIYVEANGNFLVFMWTFFFFGFGFVFLFFISVFSIAKAFML